MRHGILFAILLTAPLLAQNRDMVLVYTAEPGAVWSPGAPNHCETLGTCFYDFVDLRTNIAVVWDNGFPNGTPYVDAAADVTQLEADLAQTRQDLSSAEAEIALLTGQVEALRIENQNLTERIEALEGQPQPPPIALGESPRYRWTGYVVPTVELNHFITNTATADDAENQTCGVGPGEVCVRGTWVAGVGGAWPDAEVLTPMYYKIGHFGNIGFCGGACPEWLGPPSSQANGWMPRIPLKPVLVGGGEWLVVLAEQQWQVAD